MPFLVEGLPGLNFNLGGHQRLQALPESRGRWLFFRRRLGPKDPIHRLHQSIGDHSRAELVLRLLCRFRTVARPHQDAFLHPGIPPTLQVDELVANHIALGEVDQEFVARIE